MGLIGTSPKTDFKTLPLGWKKATIGEVAPLQRGFDLSKAQIQKGDYPIVYSNGVGEFHNTFMVKGPGVITGRSGTIGKVHYVEQNFWPHNTSLWVKNFNHNHPKFIYYVYQFIGLSRFKSGSGVPTFNRNDAHSFILDIPSSFEEQQAIAETLSDADALITSLEKLIEKKKAIKQGAMQQLLTGEKRLSGFDGDWGEARVEELVSISTGSKNTEDNKPDGRYPFFVRSQELEKIDTFSYEKEAVLTAGDGGAGKIFHYIDGKFDAHQRVYIMSDFRNQIFGKYFYWQFSTLFFNRIMSMTAKSTVDSVRREMIADMLLPLPPVKEQQAIAEALSDADKEINQSYEKLHKAKKIKAGMMQELLTGRTRLI